MRFYKKSDLTYKKQQLIDSDGNIVRLFNDESALTQLMYLDIAKQAAEYLKAQPAAVKAPSLDDFKPVVAKKRKWDLLEPAPTPLLDAKIEEGLAFIKEMDVAEQTAKINEILKTRLADLCDYASEDEVLGGIEFEYPTDHIWDYYEFNPLAVTFEEIRDTVASMVMDGMWDRCWGYACAYLYSNNFRF